MEASSRKKILHDLTALSLGLVALYYGLELLGGVVRKTINYPGLKVDRGFIPLA